MVERAFWRNPREAHALVQRLEALVRQNQEPDGRFSGKYRMAGANESRVPPSGMSTVRGSKAAARRQQLPAAKGLDLFLTVHGHALRPWPVKVFNRLSFALVSCCPKGERSGWFPVRRTETPRKFRRGCNMGVDLIALGAFIVILALAATDARDDWRTEQWLQHRKW